ncbi:MAG: hypothetical protein QG656_2336, partial [Candidatus Hydrogenedentes bacterium]|nr:hypothetical protein [Candidatus Hydrogenedentota bacterium]
MRLGVVSIVVAGAVAWTAAASAEVRILVAGDCQLCDAAQWGSYDEWLKENGYGQYQTKGDQTTQHLGLSAWAAASNEQIIQPANMPFLKAVDRDLRSNPSIEVVHLL